jgi:tRNA G18 (ribose-2'-O)-methylase SpoU
VRVTTRNAAFQQWEAMLSNRGKRRKLGQFLVQGVRPISMAIQHNWRLSAVLVNNEARLSDWARSTLDRVEARQYLLAPELLAELGGKSEDVPELVAVAKLPADDLSRLSIGPSFLGVVFDRPTAPGNIGAVIRSADAFGANAVIITGHAADPFDPKAIRASTGSLFAVPTVRADSARQVLDRMRDHDVHVIGTDESGSVDIGDCDLTGPRLLVVGNETTGMSQSWRDCVDTMARIPIAGSASSLNAATAAAIALYEAARQRR